MEFEDPVVVENTGLKLEEVDEKTVVYQSVFSLQKLLKNLRKSRCWTTSIVDIF